MMMLNTGTNDAITDAVRDAVCSGDVDLISASRALALHRRTQRYLREMHGVDPTPGEILEFATGGDHDASDAGPLQLCLFY